MAPRSISLGRIYEGLTDDPSRCAPGETPQVEMIDHVMLSEDVPVRWYRREVVPRLARGATISVEGYGPAGFAAEYDGTLHQRIRGWALMPADRVKARKAQFRARGAA